MAFDGVNFTVERGHFKLKFGTNAMCKIEDLTSSPIGKLVDMLNGDNLSLTTMRTIFACGLIPETSEKDAGDIIDELTFQKVGELIGEAFTAAFPEVVENPPKATVKK